MFDINYYFIFNFIDKLLKKYDETETPVDNDQKLRCLAYLI